MKRGIFQGAFPVGLDLAACFRLAKRAGFSGVELTLEACGRGTPTLPLHCRGRVGNPRGPLLPEAQGDTSEAILAIERSVGLAQVRPGGLQLDSTGEEIERLRREAAAAGVAVPSVATTLLFRYPLSSPIPAVREQAVRIVRKMLEAAALLGGDTVLVVPGMVTEDVPYQEVWRRSHETLSSLVPYAAGLGVTIAVENVWNRFLFSPLEFCAYVDSFQSPFVGAYLDVANVLRYGYPDQWIELLGPRLKRVHFKDYRLDVDDIRGFTHLLQGDVPWPRVMRSLAAIGYDGWAVVEVTPYRVHPEQAIFDSAQALDYLLTLS